MAGVIKLGEITPHAYFGIAMPKGGGCIMYVKLSSSVHIFTPLLLFYSLRTGIDRSVCPIFVFHGSKETGATLLKNAISRNEEEY